MFSLFLRYTTESFGYAGIGLCIIPAPAGRVKCPRYSVGLLTRRHLTGTGYLLLRIFIRGILAAAFAPPAFTGGAAAVSVTEPEGASLDMEQLSIHEGIRHLPACFIINHLNGGAGDGHPFRAFLLGTALQIYQTDTFIFVNSHKYDFCFRAVQGPEGT